MNKIDREVDDFGFEEYLENRDVIAESPPNAVALHIPPSQPKYFF